MSRSGPNTPPSCVAGSACDDCEIGWLSCSQIDHRTISRDHRYTLDSRGCDDEAISRIAATVDSRYPCRFEGDRRSDAHQRYSGEPSCRSKPGDAVSASEVWATVSFRQGERCFPACDWREKELAVELSLSNFLERICRHRLSVQKPDCSMGIEDDSGQRSVLDALLRRAISADAAAHLLKNGFCDVDPFAHDVLPLERAVSRRDQAPGLGIAANGNGIRCMLLRAHETNVVS
jgi:hypothetical protein